MVVNKRSKNMLMSSNTLDKIHWYIKAHGHNSLGSLHVLQMYFESKNSSSVEIVKKLIKHLEHFGATEKFHTEISFFEKSLKKLHESVREPNVSKRMEVNQLIDNISKNVEMIKDIINDPEYSECVHMSKIVISSITHLEKLHPHILFGDYIDKEFSGDRIKISVDLPESDADIVACGYELHLLFINLLSNAIDAIKKKGNIWIKLSYEKHKAIINISDDGTLISGSEIKKIMSKSDYSSKGEGHGHGLKIVKDVIDKYHGSFEIRIDKNINFIVELPLKD